MKKQKPPDYPKIYESFLEPMAFNISIKEQASCFNGMVNVRKFRTTVEMIDEPLEIIQQRIQDLWDNSANHHDSLPLENTAKKYNYTLIGNRGNKKQKS